MPPRKTAAPKETVLPEETKTRAPPKNPKEDPNAEPVEKVPTRRTAAPKGSTPPSSDDAPRRIQSKRRTAEPKSSLTPSPEDGPPPRQSKRRTAEPEPTTSPFFPKETPSFACAQHPGETYPEGMGPWAMPAWAVDQTAPHDATWFDTTHPPSNEFCWLTEKQQKALVPQLKAAIQKEPMAIVGIRTPQLSLFSAAVNAHTPPTAAAVLFRMARGVPSSWVADCVRHFPFLLQYVQGDGRTVDLIKAAGEKYPSVAAHYALNDVERAFIEQGAAGKKTTVPEWAKQIPERLEMAIDAVQRDWNVLAFVPPLFRTPPLLFLALEQDAGAIGLFTDAEQCAHPAWVMRAIETLSYEIIFVAHPTPDQVDKAIDDNPALVALIPKAYHTLKSAHKAAEAGLETLLFMDPVRWGQVFVDRYGVAPCMACLE